uniref:Uncharacterized protein n=1 Tax=Arundo donax TaxID=35708 RepID=A0A0A8YWV8_ARUDO
MFTCSYWWWKSSCVLNLFPRGSHPLLC